MDPMRILIADHHQIFRDALSQYIERAEMVRSVDCAIDRAQAYDVLGRRDPCDIIILNEQLPGINDASDIAEMIRRWPAVRFIVLSGRMDHDEIQSLIRCGLWGIFSQSMSGRTMVDGLRDVIEGKKFLPIARQFAARTQSYNHNFYAQETRRAAPLLSLNGGQKPGLTTREQDVLNFLVRGHTNQEIADRLGIQLVTVKLHMRNLSRKLGVRNRTEAALLARERGLVSEV
jgi:DNA-binding NarL/FixJ family response regulator